MPSTTGLLALLLDASRDDNLHRDYPLAQPISRARSRPARRCSSGTPADGLVDPDELAREALAAHQLTARAFSPTGLQHYATCPYRFFLQAIHRLQPREDPVALEVIDPLTRGGLFHEVQFEILTLLRDEKLLPITAATLDRALDLIDDTLAQVAARWEEELVPAIPRVWQDGIQSIRADLREWLRLAQTASGCPPLRAVVRPPRRDSTPRIPPRRAALASRRLRVRGSIDWSSSAPRRAPRDPTTRRACAGGAEPSSSGRRWFSTASLALAAEERGPP